MKKLLFTAKNLEMGGIEKALINLLKRINYNEYKVTLILEEKTGIFLSQLPVEVNVLEYCISDCKVTIIRKIKNRLKLIWWKKKYHNKFDFSCSFATYSVPGAHLALLASSNNAIWLHGNYYINYGDKMRAFLNTVMVKKFKRIVFVSNDNLQDVTNHYQELKEKSIVCNNFIDGEDMLKKSNEVCEIKKVITPTFLNVGRHDEFQKRLSRIINASEQLINENYQFQVLFIGDGPDSDMYKKMVSEKKLQDTIIFLGKKENPYPYFKLADAVVLSSPSEGYPVVFLEAMVLNKPIISTEVSDFEPLKDIYGIFNEQSTKGIYLALKNYLDNGFKIKEAFDYVNFNKDIERKIKAMFNDEV